MPHPQQSSHFYSLLSAHHKQQHQHLQPPSIPRTRSLLVVWREVPWPISLPPIPALLAIVVVEFLLPLPLLPSPLLPRALVQEIDLIGFGVVIRLPTCCVRERRRGGTGAG